MAIRTVANQYVGINAHLHSYFQSQGGWDSFHANHIADLMRLMNVQLLPLGYVADIQQSLQIRRFGEPAGKPESDVTIYDTDVMRRHRPASSLAGDSQPIAIPEAMSIDPEIEQIGLSLSTNIKRGEATRVSLWPRLSCYRLPINPAGRTRLTIVTSASNCFRAASFLWNWIIFTNHRQPLTSFLPTR